MLLRFPEFVQPANPNMDRFRAESAARREPPMRPPAPAVPHEQEKCNEDFISHLRPDIRPGSRSGIRTNFQCKITARLFCCIALIAASGLRVFRSCPGSSVSFRVTEVGYVGVLRCRIGLFPACRLCGVSVDTGQLDVCRVRPCLARAGLSVPASVTACFVFSTSLRCS